jgi:hypothetical protein
MRIKKNDIFELYFEGNYFHKKDIITVGKNVEMLVLHDPHSTWWRRFLKRVTFGLYQAPTTYKCKVIEKER